MTIPNLKRIKVASAAELTTWLRKNADQTQEVMIVTCGPKSPDKYIASDSVRHSVAQLGWISGQSYTLPGNLVGHVVRRR